MRAVMDFPGTWMTPSGSMVYRVVPKCACSTIGQVMYFSDHGSYFDGDIHDAEGLEKWENDRSRPAIAANITGGRSLVFTSVRNPYARILSCFFDKIAGVQRSGRRYRSHMIGPIVQRYGIDVGSPENGFKFDQIASFRRFLLLARDTLRFGKPMEPDIHWSPISGHVGTLVASGGRYDMILFTETLKEGMQKILNAADAPHAIDIAEVPRFNESAGHGPKRAHKPSAYFDDLGHQLMWEIYRKDFQLFRYDFDNPDNPLPKGEVDLEELHRRLAKG